MLVALLVGIGLLPNLGESAMIKRSLEQLSQEADIILLGTVTKQVSEWNDQRTAIHTDVTVAVEEAIKGWPGGEVACRVVESLVTWVCALRRSSVSRRRTGRHISRHCGRPGPCCWSLSGNKYGTERHRHPRWAKRVGYELYRCYPRCLPISVVAGHKMRGLR